MDDLDSSLRRRRAVMAVAMVVAVWVWWPSIASILRAVCRTEFRGTYDELAALFLGLGVAAVGLVWREPRSVSIPPADRESRDREDGIHDVQSVLERLAMPPVSEAEAVEDDLVNHPAPQATRAGDTMEPSEMATSTLCETETSPSSRAGGNFETTFFHLLTYHRDLVATTRKGEISGIAAFNKYVDAMRTSLKENPFSESWRMLEPHLGHYVRTLDTMLMLIAERSPDPELHYRILRTMFSENERYLIVRTAEFGDEGFRARVVASGILSKG